MTTTSPTSSSCLEAATHTDAFNNSCADKDEFRTELAHLSMKFSRPDISKMPDPDLESSAFRQFCVNYIQGNEGNEVDLKIVRKICNITYSKIRSLAKAKLASQSTDVQQQVEDHMNYGCRVFASLMELIKKVNVERWKIVKDHFEDESQSLSERDVFVNEEAWSEFEEKYFDDLRKQCSKPHSFFLNLWLRHLKWVAIQVNHEIEFKTLDLPKTLTVKDQDNQDVEAELEVKTQEWSGKKDLKLRIQKTLIGKANIVFCKHQKYIFVTSLRNHSIDRRGNRKFSQVGTVLLDTIKKISLALGYHSVLLTAMTPFHTPLPKNNDLVIFYQKNDFIINEERSYRFGVAMKWVIPN